jgi:hypothetical protein
VSWHDLDWLEVQVWDYQTALNDRVREAYLAAHSVLEKTFAAREKWYEQEMARAEDEANAEAAHEQLQSAEIRWHEQRQALAAMTFALLAIVNKSFLDGMKKFFDKTRAPDPKGYLGKSQLQRQAAEYMARFDVGLERIAGFESIREVELARHCCLHKEGELTDDYRHQTKQRFVAEDGRINLTAKGLDDLLLELGAFSKELCNCMKAVRAKPVQRDQHLPR